MTHERASGRLRLTQRGRIARTTLVFGVGVAAIVSMLGSGDNHADALDALPSPIPMTTSADVSSEAISAPMAVVGFGDSVPSGAVCKCANFVSVYAKRLSGGTSVANYAEGGSTSADALARLDEHDVSRDVRNATTVLIMTGANDFSHAFDAVADGADAEDTYGSIAKQVRLNVTAQVSRIHKLNPRAHVVVLDYWAAMEDGAVARQDYDAAGLKAAAQATDWLNDALASAAKATDATLVSTRTAFKGADGKSDPTPFLSKDGDHPNAAGHKLIADAIADVLPRG